MQEIYLGGLLYGGDSREKDRWEVVAVLYEGPATRGNVQNLVAGGDVAGGAESLKADLGLIWFWNVGSSSTIPFAKAMVCLTTLQGTCFLLKKLLSTAA